MKSTGVVRKVDALGRVVFPKELRDCMGLEEGTPMEIFTTGDSIVIRKYQPGCVVCGSIHYLKYINDKGICIECIEKLK